VGTSHTDMERTLKVELTEIRIRAAKPQEKPYKLTDGRGLHLLVTPGGSRLWRIRYRYNGPESTMGVGAYPDVTLKDTRASSSTTRARRCGTGSTRLRSAAPDVRHKRTRSLRSLPNGSTRSGEVLSRQLSRRPCGCWTG
jgi:hypothetical protein